MKQRLRPSKPWPCLLFLPLFTACCLAQTAPFAFPGKKPADAPPRWKEIIGEYESLLVLEKSGKLILQQDDGTDVTLEPAADGNFTIAKPGQAPSIAQFSDAPTAILLIRSVDEITIHRRKPGSLENQLARITPVHPVEDLRKQALAAAPPREEREFRAPDLVELAPLDPSIHLDIRYATSNDFLGTPVYTQARAFLQRPAAEALLRALHRLKPFGYALLIHDAYRPWYVTKIFWDATPPEGKIFVADPVQGSRHNRGCAVDLTLYDLKSGRPIEMPGTYDEMSPRSFPDYPGGTSLQRWHRDLLRWAMESEGFAVYEHEWWHFDFKDWHAYPILNVPFEKLEFAEKQPR